MALTEKYVTTTGSEAWATNSSGNPSSLAEALANAAAGERVNIKSGTYTISSALTITVSGTTADPIVWRGYDTTIGDGYQGRNADGTLDDSNMPHLSFTGTGNNLNASNDTYWVWDSIKVTSTSFTGSNLTRFGVGTFIVNSIFDWSGSGHTSGKTVDLATNSTVTNCDITNTCTNTLCGIESSGDVMIVGNRISCVNGAGVINTVDGSIINNLIFECTDGIDLVGANSRRGSIVGNTIVDCTGDGIDTSNHLQDDIVRIVANLITDISGYGFDSEYTTADYGALFFANRFDRTTSGDISTRVGDWPNIEPEDTSEATQGNEYTDPSTDDYTLESGAPGIDALDWLPNSNIGYWQNGA